MNSPRKAVPLTGSTARRRPARRSAAASSWLLIHSARAKNPARKAWRTDSFLLHEQLTSGPLPASVLVVGGSSLPRSRFWPQTPVRTPSQMNVPRQKSRTHMVPLSGSQPKRSPKTQGLCVAFWSGTSWLRFTLQAWSRSGISFYSPCSARGSMTERSEHGGWARCARVKRGQCCRFRRSAEERLCLSSPAPQRSSLWGRCSKF